MTTADEYLSTPGWSEVVTEVIHGRPTQLYRERLHNVVDLLDISAAQADQVLLVHGDRRITFGEFVPATLTGAAQLARAGVRPGDRVMIFSYNCAEFLLAMWAVWRVGAVPTLANRWWSDRELDDVMASVRPAVVVTDALDHPVLAGAPVMGMGELAGWWNAAPAPVAPPPAVDETEVALIVYTAGSTGAPKGVQLSHLNLVITQQILHQMAGGRPPAPTRPEEQKVALMTTPMFHNGGVTASLTALVDGNRMVFLRNRFDAVEAMELIERERANSWNAVPTMYSRLLRHERAGQFDLSSLASPSTGGTMVVPEFLALARRGLPDARTGMSVGYGMTEMAFISIATGDQVEARPGTVGRPIPLVEVAIADADEHGEGEVIGRSPAMMIGYHETETQPIDGEGWYHTGDRGRLDDEGFIYITGRVKDMVIRGGENISCPHVEQTIGTHPAVVEIAVVGLPDSDLGEQLGAVVSVGDAPVSELELIDFARGRLARFEVPTRWLLVSEPLPTNATGKIDKPVLRERFLVAEES
ncbi:MAG TPA: class I adenylate-forming enzyme family protein [Acidimicrobiales bacterium]|jgi:acyl-CoA synthetase (AMP-forming)/AMP-acid ligase II|nr:class I adenylate-forming enzyme family protein [Acidimicrobiales bacterium]